MIFIGFLLFLMIPLMAWRWFHFVAIQDSFIQLFERDDDDNEDSAAKDSSVRKGYMKSGSCKKKKLFPCFVGLYNPGYDNERINNAKVISIIL